MNITKYIADLESSFPKFQTWCIITKGINPNRIDTSIDENRDYINDLYFTYFKAKDLALYGK